MGLKNHEPHGGIHTTKRMKFTRDNGRFRGIVYEPFRTPIEAFTFEVWPTVGAPPGPRT